MYNCYLFKVYNETIRDLLDTNKVLNVREDTKNGTSIPGLSVHKPRYLFSAHFSVIFICGMRVHICIWSYGKKTENPDHTLKEEWIQASRFLSFKVNL